MKYIKPYESHNESWRKTKAYLRVPALVVDIALSKLLNYVPKLNFLYKSMAAKIDSGTSFNFGTRLNDTTGEMSEQLEDPMENLYAAYGLDSLGRIRTTCYGDSGGPLVDGKGLLIGLTSFAMVDSCEELAPTVYTKVASYRTWIQRNSITIQSRYARMNPLSSGNPILDDPSYKHPIKVYGRW